MNEQSIDLTRAANEILLRAAQEGDQFLIKAAIAWGATEFDQAYQKAKYYNQFDAAVIIFHEIRTNETEKEAQS